MLQDAWDLYRFAALQQDRKRDPVFDRLIGALADMREYRVCEAAHQIWMGDGKHFMVFPVRRGELLNYVGFVPTSDQTLESWSAVGR